MEDRVAVMVLKDVTIDSMDALTKMDLVAEAKVRSMINN